MALSLFMQQRDADNAPPPCGVRPEDNSPSLGHFTRIILLCTVNAEQMLCAERKSAPLYIYYIDNKIKYVICRFYCSATTVSFSKSNVYFMFDFVSVRVFPSTV